MDAAREKEKKALVGTVRIQVGMDRLIVGPTLGGLLCLHLGYGIWDRVDGGGKSYE